MEFIITPCRFGLILIAVTDIGICSILFGDKKTELEKELHKRFPNEPESKIESAKFKNWVNEILAGIENPTKQLNLPLDLRGTPFQQNVWHALQKIPAGKLSNYTEIAKQIGKPKAIRAVAGACAGNPIAFAIPCHRIIKLNGEISGYRWGVERKRKMLKYEGILI